MKTLVLPRAWHRQLVLATLETGQVLACVQKTADEQVVVLYNTLSEQPVVLTATTTRDWLIMLGHGSQVLAGVRWGSQLFLGNFADGNVTWHTVDALNGEKGVWLTNIRDVALWDNCVYVADAYGPLVLLCPV